MKQARFEINNLELTIVFNNSITAQKIFDRLPFAGNIQRWGDELFFDVAFSGIELESNARDVLEIGEVAFWVEGSAIAMFFGPTPASQNKEPRSLEPVNVFGKIIGDVSKLSDVRDGDFIYMQALPGVG